MILDYNKHKNDAFNDAKGHFVTVWVAVAVARDLNVFLFVNKNNWIEAGMLSADYSARQVLLAVIL